MAQEQTVSWDDTIIPFTLERADVRGRITRLDDVLAQVLHQHDYPPLIEKLLCELVVLTALIGQTMKLRWKLSLQVRGSGAIRILATDYYAPTQEGAPARIRAYASFDAKGVQADAPAFAQLGKGYFAVLIDQGKNTAPYQGITPLTGGSLSTCAQSYFMQSEQIPTSFAIASKPLKNKEQKYHWRAGGIMLQHIPTSAKTPNPATPTDENWHRVKILLETVQANELIDKASQLPHILHLLFHDEGLKPYEPQSVTFGCTCSADRVRQSLSIYSAKEIAQMTTAEGRVTAKCQFCGAGYRFDPQTLGFEAKNNDTINDHA